MIVLRKSAWTSAGWALTGATGSNAILNRQFDRDEDILRQSLANRGLTGAGTAELGEAAGTEHKVH